MNKTTTYKFSLEEIESILLRETGHKHFEYKLDFSHLQLEDKAVTLTVDELVLEELCLCDN